MQILSSRKVKKRLLVNVRNAIIGDLKVKLKLYDVKFETQETKVDEIVNNFKLDKRILEYEIEWTEKNWKLQNKSLKVKDKEIHDLKKTNEQTAENLVKVNAEYKDIKAKVNKEKKDEEKKANKIDKKEFLNSLTHSLKEESLECDICDMKVESLKGLKMHERIVHMKSNSAQTEETNLKDKYVQFSVLEFSKDNCSNFRSKSSRTQQISLLLLHHKHCE